MQTSKHETITREITNGSLNRAIWTLALPACLSMLMTSFYSMNDIFWTGRAADAKTLQAALGGMIFLIIMNISAAHVFGVGATALVARYTGARDEKSVSFCIRQALSWGVIFAAALGAAEFIFAPELVGCIFRSDKMGAVVFENGVTYCRILVAFLPVMLMVPVCAAIFRARGDTRTPFLIDVLSIGLNTALNPLFLFGFGWGIAGIAAATVISRAAALAVYMFIIFGGALGVKISLGRGFIPHVRTLGRFLRIGVPSSISTLLYAVIGIYLGRIIQEFGEAAYTGSISIGLMAWESLSFHLMLGISFVASTMVGQNLGAGKPARAAKAGWVTALYACALGVIFAIVFNAFPETLVMFFNSKDTEVIAHAVMYLRIVTLSHVFMGLHIALSGAFGGAGNTLPPMLFSVLLTGSRIPIACLLAFDTCVAFGCVTLPGAGIGITGIWWTMFATTFLNGAVLAGWFALGRWKKYKV
jgi:putative MATE family efflux protein